MIRHLILLLAISLASLTSAARTDSISGDLAGDPDDPGFISASLLIASPGTAIYQFTGHAMILMECPAAGLSYVFSFESENIGGNLLKNLTTNTMGSFAAVQTDEYLEQFSREGRTVSKLPLNLKPREKQELWRLLDQLIAKDASRFNIREKSCSSQLIEVIATTVSPSKILAPESDIIGRDNGLSFKRLAELGHPWYSLAISLTVGNDANEIDFLKNQSVPTLIIDQWDKYFIVGRDGSRRPLFTSAPEIIIPGTGTGSQPAPITPSMAASAVMLLCVIISLLQWFGRWPRLVRAFDIILFSYLALIGCMLIFVICSPASIGGIANWYLVLFNPLPVILWFILRDRPRPLCLLRLAYSIVLDLFAITLPWLVAGAPAAVSILALATALRALQLHK